MSTLMDRLENELPNKANFNPFLQLNWSNVRLEQCQRL